MRRRVALTLAALLALSIPAPGAAQKSKARSVLRSVETYKAPPYPSAEAPLLAGEFYDLRRRDGLPVPPTLTDTFVRDLWRIIDDRVAFGSVGVSHVKPGHVSRALQFYLTRGWKDVPGQRPWTHWNFVRRLTPAQRRQLSREVSAYMRRYGVRDIPR